MNRPTVPLHVLMVEDDENDALLVLRELKRGGYDVRHERVETAADMREALARGGYQLVLSDYSLPAFSALGATAVLKESGRDIPLIVVSGTIGEETAVEVLRAGARDFVGKGRLARLVPAIQRELTEYAARASEAAKLRAAEAQLVQAQKMEAIGRLAGGVAHDFNNLLSVILSYAEMLSSGRRDDDPVRADLHEILHAAERATELTRHLLAFSRSQVLKPRVVDVREVVGEMGRMLARVLPGDVKLEVPTTGAPLKATVDPGQLEQILMNLVVNARDAVQGRGEIAIDLEPVEVAPGAEDAVDLPPGPYVRLSVTDTGAGMDADVQARIFEPFFTTKPVGQGTGLGLSTVFGIVKQSKGHIRVRSEVGAGTRFEVDLPASSAAPLSSPPRDGAVRSRRGRGETVLVVDDDPAVFSLVRAILSGAGYTVVGGTDPVEVLARAEGEAAIDLLLSDVVLPGMSGPELARRVAERRPGARILFMTGYTRSAVLDGSHDVLQKPITPGALLRKVREVLDG